jgi:hypothetical protein
MPHRLADPDERWCDLRAAIESTHKMGQTVFLGVSISANSHLSTFNSRCS